MAVCNVSAKRMANVWHLGAVLALAAVPASGDTPGSRSVGGAKFIGTAERGDGFRKAFVPRGCRTLSEGYRICLEGSEYVLEKSLPDGRNRLDLFRKSDTETAIIKSIFFPLRATSALSPNEVDALIQKHLFEDAQDGPRTITRQIFTERSPSGHVVRGAVEFTDSSGSRRLSVFDVSRQQWGMGYIETLTLLEDNTTPRIEDAKIRHTAFLDLVRVVVGVGPGY